MIRIKQATIIRSIREKKLTEAQKLIARTRAIRKQITGKSGQWDAAETLRTLRYAQ